MHAFIWFTTYYSCICQARVHANETRKMKTRVLFKQKCMSAVCPYQNAQVKIVQTMLHTAAN